MPSTSKTPTERPFECCSLWQSEIIHMAMGFSMFFLLPIEFFRYLFWLTATCHHSKLDLSIIALPVVKRQWILKLQYLTCFPVLSLQITKTKRKHFSHLPEKQERPSISTVGVVANQIDHNRALDFSPLAWLSPLCAFEHRHLWKALGNIRETKHRHSRKQMELAPWCCHEVIKLHPKTIPFLTLKAVGKTKNL